MAHDYDRRTAAEDAAFWKEREKHHEREIQNIKKRLKKYHGGVFNEYLGLGAEKANKLRKLLEHNRVAMGAASVGKPPTKQELEAAVRKLGPAVQRARV